jgi:hypothetical protein
MGYQLRGISDISIAEILEQAQTLSSKPHYFRRDPASAQRVASQDQQRAVTPITWLEVLAGAANKESLSRYS